MKWILIGLSGTDTSCVSVPTSSPVYSMRYLWTNFTINMYNSNFAKRCPMQDLGEKRLPLENGLSYHDYLAPWPNGILAKESALCLSGQPLNHLSGENLSGLGKFAGSLELVLPHRTTVVPFGILYPPITRSVSVRLLDPKIAGRIL